MEGVRDKAAKRQKRDKKRRLEGKKKSRIRAAQLAMGQLHLQAVSRIRSKLLLGISHAFCIKPSADS